MEAPGTAGCRPKRPHQVGAPSPWSAFSSSPQRGLRERARPSSGVGGHGGTSASCPAYLPWADDTPCLLLPGLGAAAPSSRPAPHRPPPLGPCPCCAPGRPGPLPAFSLLRGPHFLPRGASCDPPPPLGARALLCHPPCSACTPSHFSRVRPRDPVDRSLPGSSVHGVLWARILEWVAVPSSRASSPPRDHTRLSYVSCSGRWVLYHSQAHPSKSPWPRARPAVCGAPVGGRPLFTAAPQQELPVNRSLRE